MPANLHGTALVIGEHGIFIRGTSGAGKTMLALSLLARAAAANHHARLVADDQIFVASVAGRLVAHAPQSIAGLVEVYGYGPCPINWQKSAVIDLIVTLVSPETAERLPDPGLSAIHGVDLPELRLAARNAGDATSAVLAKLGFSLIDAICLRQNS